MPVIKTPEEIKAEYQSKLARLQGEMESKLEKAANFSKKNPVEISQETQRLLRGEIKENNLDVNLRGGVLNIKNISGDTDDFVEKMISRVNRNLRVSGYSTTLANIGEEWDLLIEELTKFKESQISEFLKVYTDDNLEELTKFLAILKLKKEDIQNPPLGLDVVVHAHMLQQVKKKFLFRGDKTHMYPIACCWKGVNGCGKSWALKFLCDKTSTSLMPLFASKIGDSISDIRNQYSVYSTYFLLLDDITELKKESVGLLRNIITDSYSNIRKMNNNKGTDIRNNSTIFLTANISLADLFDEPQEVRRYWQFNCVDKLPKNVKKDIFDKLEKINYTKIWESISLDKEYINAKVFQEEIYPYQERWLLYSQPISEFIENYSLFSFEEDTEKEEVRLDLLFKMYLKFVEFTHRQTRMTTTRFKTSLNRLGVDPCRQPTTNNRVDRTFYLLNKSAKKEYMDVMYQGVVEGEV